MSIFIWMGIFLGLSILGLIIEKKYVYITGILIGIFIVTYMMFGMVGDVKGKYLGEGISTITQETNGDIITQYFNGFDNKKVNISEVTNGILANPRNYIIDMTKRKCGNKLMTIPGTYCEYKLKKHIED